MVALDFNGMFTMMFAFFFFLMIALFVALKIFGALVIGWPWILVPVLASVACALASTIRGAP